MVTPLDLARLGEALELATSAIGLSDPNPRVGCVIGHLDGRVLGRGHTQQVGGPHAEVVALREASRDGPLEGACAWVTLEPCAHHGRTPPCTDALIRAGIRRVVVALRDPFPAVDGRGLERLRDAGMEVLLADPAAGAEQAAIVRATAELNIGFLQRIRHGRPWVRAKLAASLDGRVALADGRSQWITSAEARADGHRWRARAGAILTGIGTVLADDPRLDVRGPRVAQQPRRIVLDSRARMPPDARMLREASGGPVTVVNIQPRAAEQPWHDAFGRPVAFRNLGPAPEGGLDLHELTAQLGQDGINELHVEAGPVLSGAMHRAGLIDEWLLYLAPRMLGQGPHMLQGATGEGLSEPAAWRIQESLVFGADLRLRLRKGDFDVLRDCRKS
jgi:diaminohydroxyphosphoribosylaminopyrimidine deaminase / 5-amino-6-(5-phosphoribosylamino)uracil reductase